MLRFMYTDACPADDEIGDSLGPRGWHVLAFLAAADRFALDCLKILCAGKLWDNISVHTVAATSICAGTFN
jgi:speckle-type POZ protein